MARSRFDSANAFLANFGLIDFGFAFALDRRVFGVKLQFVVLSKLSNKIGVRIRLLTAQLVIDVRYRQNNS
jgi:hypothetical protein